ncbi:MAG: hypothetical protein ABRQ39_12745 [Candidatus Eremiobacterota bacterium]
MLHAYAQISKNLSEQSSNVLVRLFRKIYNPHAKKPVLTVCYDITFSQIDYKLPGKNLQSFNVIVFFIVFFYDR